MAHNAATHVVWLLLASIVLVAVVRPSDADPTSGKGRSRAEAVRRIPYDKLTTEAQAKINSVVRKPTLYRKMPTNQITCDPQLYRFMIRYPEVVVNIWQLMGITKVKANRTAPFVLQATDGVGTVTNVELVYGDQHTHLMYCDGHYEGPLFGRPITGRCVLLLRSDFEGPADQGKNVTNTMDVFLQVDNVAVDVVARTFHPLVGRSADLNFQQSTKFLERIWQTTKENGPGMSRLAERLHQVQPQVRKQFAQLTRSAYEIAQSQQREEVR